MSSFPLTSRIMQEILHSLSEGIHIVDQTGKTVYHNQVSSSLDGLPSKDVIGIHVLKAFPSLTDKTSTLLRVLSTGVPEGERQQTYMNSKGQSITSINKTIPLWEGGKLIGAMEISRDITQIKELSERVVALQDRVKRSKEKGNKPDELYEFQDIVTEDPVFLQEIEKGKRAALTDLPVLVVGETGTGKELFVQSLHTHSPRKNNPFIVQNCASIPITLLESLLFGTVKGAYTGSEDRPGLFELADGGTLFLDEIQSMPWELQAKLLRVLEDGSIRRVGDIHQRRVNVRILIATNEDPRKNVREGKLREDLFYRIHVIRIDLPPLRDRKSDIQLLTNYFLGNREEQGLSRYTVSTEVFSYFHLYEWPGNVRELKHTLESASFVAEGRKIQPEHLPKQIREIEDNKVWNTDGSNFEKIPLPKAVQNFERECIRHALSESQGRLVMASKILGIPRQTLQYKIIKLGLQSERKIID